MSFRCTFYYLTISATPRPPWQTFSGLARLRSVQQLSFIFNSKESETRMLIRFSEISREKKTKKKSKTWEYNVSSGLPEELTIESKPAIEMQLSNGNEATEQFKQNPVS